MFDILSQEIDAKLIVRIYHFIEERFVVNPITTRTRILREGIVFSHVCLFKFEQVHMVLVGGPHVVDWSSWGAEQGGRVSHVIRECSLSIYWQVFLFCMFSF